MSLYIDIMNLSETYFRVFGKIRLVPIRHNMSHPLIIELEILKIIILESYCEG